MPPTPTPARMLAIALLLLAAIQFGCRKGPADDGPGPQGEPPQQDERGEEDQDEEQDPFSGTREHGDDGPFTQEMEDGSSVTGRFKENKRHGLWLRKAANGKLLFRAHFAAGQLDGDWASYYSWGPQVRETGRYSGGLSVATWRMYYPNGKLFEVIEHKAGEAHGRWTMHHPDGSLADEMQWLAGKQVGEEINYAPGGKVIARGQYSNHRPSGTWTCFDQDGKDREIPAPDKRITPRQACGLGEGPEDPPQAHVRP